MKPDGSKSVLTIGKSRLTASVGLSVWLALVTVFYYALITSTTGESTGAYSQSPGVQRWILFLFPLMIIPYLIDCIRGLSRNNQVVFDNTTRIVRKNRRTVATFDQITQLQLETVNGRCEELMLSAVLQSGDRIEIQTGTGRHVDKLAAELSHRLGTRVERLA